MVENILEKRASQILVIEDEIEIRELISLLLLRQGHTIQQCGSAVQALDYLKKIDFDLVILDWMLPQMSGIDLLKHWPAEIAKMPILMVTAKTEPQDIVQGLEAGADDYVTKPFEPGVFMARVKALLRRATNLKKVSSDSIYLGGLAVNLASYEVSCHGENIHLTPSEFKILTTLAQNQGKVLTREHLIGVVQGEGISVTGRTVDTHVFGLRKKLGDCSDWIETIRGIGYRVRTTLSQ